MPDIWQYSAGYTHEFDDMIETLQSYDVPFCMRFEKGRAIMSREPQVGDEVWISSRTVLVAKGIIREAFHMHRGALFAMVEIQEIAYEQPKIQTYRRNWINIT